MGKDEGRGGRGGEREREVREGSNAIECLAGLENLCGIRVSTQISQKITARWGDPIAGRKPGTGP